MQPEIPANQRHHRFFIAEDFITLKNIGQTGTDPEYFAPLVQGISVVDLERFLAILFPTEYGQHDATSFDEWASILKVAHHWEFESIFKLALENIEPISSPVDKVVIGKTYNIPEWAAEARVLLCRRDEPITLEEASRMGMEEVVNISQTRHHIRSSEIRSGIQDSAIRSLLSGEQADKESDKVVEITLPPQADPSQAAHFGLMTASGQPMVDDAPIVRKDPRICRSLELRAQLRVLKNQLAALKGLGTASSGQECEDVETQIDNLEEEELELFTGVHPIQGPTDFNGNWKATESLSITRTSITESCVQSMLTRYLHPEATVWTLCIDFPQFNTRKRPQQIALNVLDRYGLSYTTNATTGAITVPIPSRLMESGKLAPTWPL
ncbi:hypothetical protein BDN72DRAFT_845102 [Pluteus cervinus]|uniref:Uncharacterized protein n=1 Tax=Pluteus cervinus TaxID=181527 RepID=A0ACD3AJ96_9AGAR|nr:hypothetical protein BDN72DRAFT_845102 [Pluteus cervinus]